MEQIENFHLKQQVPAAQLNDMQAKARSAIDHVVYDGITDEFKYTGFTASQSATTEATLAAGRVFKLGEVYALNVESVHNMLPLLPTVTQKIVAIAANVAEVDSTPEPVKILLDSETRQTNSESRSTEKHRNAIMNLIPGTESAAPQKPTVETNLLVLCWVWLDNAGITKIEMNEAGRLPSAKKNAQRITSLETWKGTVDQQVDTIGTDITALAQRQSSVDASAFLTSLATDVALLKETLELEDGYVSYGADRYLDDGESDTDHVNYLAKLDEGVRFSNEAEDLEALTLFTPLDPTVIVADGLCLPKYAEVRRQAVEVPTEYLSLSQYPFETVDWVEKHMSRSRIRYGDARTVCTNSSWWRTGRYDAAQEMFFRDGDVWEVTDDPTRSNPKFKRLRRFWIDTVEEHYWDRIVTDHSVNGAMAAQTFLNAQDNWLTSLELLFGDVGPTGDVTVLIAETNAGGKPDKNAVLKSVTVPVAELVPNDWNVVDIPATFLTKGRHYAICVVTQGLHYVAMTSGENYSQGTYFYSTDGAFLMGDLTKDMCFRLNVAQFESPRLEVRLGGLSLSGGITDIDILAQIIVPGATNLIFEVKPQGGNWTPIEEVKTGGTLFAGQPALCDFRAVFLGTKDVMPGIDLVNSTTRISRPRITGKHISETITLPTATQSLKVTLKLEEFYETNHDCDVTIDDITNAVNAIAPATVTDQVVAAGDDANHKTILRTFEWTATELTTALDEFVINIDIDTTSPLDVFHVSHRVHLSF